jgi:hypothetical protein
VEDPSPGSNREPKLELALPRTALPLLREVASSSRNVIQEVPAQQDAANTLPALLLLGNQNPRPRPCLLSTLVDYVKLVAIGQDGVQISLTTPFDSVDAVTRDEIGSAPG